jgi:ATP-dependent RNA helicase DHX37/DHR1
LCFLCRFPPFSDFPVAPDRSQIDAAVKLLADIGCLSLSNVERDGGDGTITRLGLAVSKLPLGVRYAKMLLVAAEAGVLDYAIIAVAMLSESSPFSNHVSPESSEGSEQSKNVDLEDLRSEKTLSKKREQQHAKARKWYHSSGDVVAAISAIGAYTYAGKGAGGAAEELANRRFCADNGLNYSVMARIQKMRKHLANIAKRRLGTAPGVAAATGSFSHKLPPPNEVQERFLMQSIASSLLDHVAILATPGSISRHFPIGLRSAYIGCRSSSMEPLFLDRTSTTYSRDFRQLPKWICYDSVIRKIAKDGTAITVMRNITPVDPQWLGEISKDTRLVSLGPAVGTPYPVYDVDRDALLCSVTTRYGNHGWIVPPVRMKMSDALHTLETKASHEFLSDDTFRWFGRFLLEGKVIPELSSLAQLMNDGPDMITRKCPSSKVGLLVGSLRAAGVDSAGALRTHWAQNDDKFLFKSIISWVKPEYHAKAKKIWVDIVRQGIKEWKKK